MTDISKLGCRVKSAFFETFLVLDTDHGLRIFEEVILDSKGRRLGINAPPPLQKEEVPVPIKVPEVTVDVGVTNPQRLGKLDPNAPTWAEIETSRQLQTNARMQAVEDRIQTTMANLLEKDAKTSKKLV